MLEIMVSVIISVGISLFLNAVLLRSYALHMQKRFLDVYEKIRILSSKLR